ncbi:MAG: hypothetical protein Fur0018_21360 [Anaerolineales bacterium]
MGYVSQVEPDWVETTTIRHHMMALPGALHGYRIVHISDLHYDAIWMTARRLQSVVQAVNALRSNLIVITGDFITDRPPEAGKYLVEALSRLRAADGVLAVPGNHDYWSSIELIADVTRAAGIVFLRNMVYSLPGGSLHIAGLDDALEGYARLSTVLDATPPEGVAILLAHEPDVADHSAASGRFGLQLSGHSHGGQVVLPGSGVRPILPSMARKYPSGLYKIGTMRQYTNRGLGMTAPRVRFNCRPEITLHILESASAS